MVISPCVIPLYFEPEYIDSVTGDAEDADDGRSGVVTATVVAAVTWLSRLVEAAEADTGFNCS
jgi:hypothetical protein